MATPIRMAPVLYGKDAEFFYEQWAKSLTEPQNNLPTKEEKAKMDSVIAKFAIKRYAQLL